MKGDTTLKMHRNANKGIKTQTERRDNVQRRINAKMRINANRMRNNMIPKAFCFCLFVVVFFCCCFLALCPKSTAKFISGRSVHLTTLFPVQA